MFHLEHTIIQCDHRSKPYEICEKQSKASTPLLSSQSDLTHSQGRPTLLCPYSIRLGLKASDRDDSGEESNGGMFKDTLLNTHMRKKKDELGCLQGTFEGFLCPSFPFACYSQLFLLSATFFPLHTRKLSDRRIFLSPSRGMRLSAPKRECIYSMHVCVDQSAP